MRPTSAVRIGPNLAAEEDVLLRHRVWIVAMVMVAFVAVGARQQQATAQVETTSFALIR